MKLKSDFFFMFPQFDVWFVNMWPSTQNFDTSDFFKFYFFFFPFLFFFFGCAFRNCPRAPFFKMWIPYNFAAFFFCLSLSPFFWVYWHVSAFYLFRRREFPFRSGCTASWFLACFAQSRGEIGVRSGNLATSQVVSCEPNLTPTAAAE